MGSERIEQDWVTEQKQRLIWEHLFVHLDCIQFLCGVFLVASLVDRGLRSNYLVSWCFYQAPYTFVELSSKISQYKPYPDCNVILSPLVSTSKSMNLQVVLRSLMPTVNHWLPHVEGFLGVHLTTDQECSGKLSSIHHHTHRTNQRHKEKLMLGRWKLVPSNLLIMWIFSFSLCCLCRLLRGMLWNSPHLL